ncbi:peroxide stress protein YaaA [Ideonella sp.]|uniref:peroxide stress protein YaaA n=1 Tax=Ideonella sp. TaxID=1929293 RepID=UPI003BB7E559
MLYLLSPAKTLDYETPVPAEVLARATRPQFVEEAATLIDVLRARSPAEIAQLMDLSDPLAQLNVARYGAWSRRFTDANSRPAVLAFNGDVYEGLQAQSLSTDELDWAQKHVAILSGLYGVLRPLDKLQPYRLEMGTRLATPGAADLYGYWGDRLAEHLNARQARERSPVIVNLASQEYFKAARRKALRARVIECVFEEWHGGTWKVISFYAKRARGLMARFAVQQRVDQPVQLQAFDDDGYAFDAAASQADRWVFRRTQVA